MRALALILLIAAGIASAQEARELPKLSADEVYQHLRSIGYVVQQPPPNGFTTTISRNGITLRLTPLLDAPYDLNKIPVRALRLSRVYQAAKKVPEEMLSGWTAGGQRLMSSVYVRARIDGSITLESQIEMSNGTTDRRLEMDLGHVWSLMNHMDMVASQVGAKVVDNLVLRKPAPLDNDLRVFFLDREELTYLVEQWGWAYRGPRGGSGGGPDLRVLSTVEGAFVELQPWTNLYGQPGQPVFALDTYLQRPADKDLEAHLAELRLRYPWAFFGESPYGIVVRQIVSLADGMKLGDIRLKLLEFARRSKELPGYMPSP